MKSILFLDANETIIPAILYAKELGYRTITCDNIPSHPGHSFADATYNISTYDIESLVSLAKKENVCGVVYFSSAHGLYGGSALIEQLHLPGIPGSVEKLFSDKGSFREFLQDNNLNYPAYKITDTKSLDLESVQYPVIVKPVDSSGGNIGVVKVNSPEKMQVAMREAIDCSFSHRALIEEFIESDLQINGDCLVSNGKVVLFFTGKYLYASKTSIIPYATIFGPDVIDEQSLHSAKEEIQQIVSKAGIKNGIINVELRINKADHKPYTIEINSRHSGNKIYKLMNVEYGQSFEHIAVDIARGKSLETISSRRNGYYAYCILYSKQDGVLRQIHIAPELNENIIERFDFKQENEAVHEFKLLRDRVSLLLLSFKDKKEMEDMVYHIENYYHIEFVENGTDI